MHNHRHTQSIDRPSLVWHAAGQSCAPLGGRHPPPSVCGRPGSAHECVVRLHPCPLGLHCCTGWHHTAQNVQIQRFTASTDHLMWPFMEHTLGPCIPPLVSTSCQTLCWMRSLVFIPRHGRLGDHHIHSVGQMPSIYGVCFHHWETQQTLDNLGPFSLFVHCLSVTHCQQTVVRVTNRGDKTFWCKSKMGKKRR